MILQDTGLVVVGTRFPPDLFSEQLFKLLHSGIQLLLLSERQPPKNPVNLIGILTV